MERTLYAVQELEPGPRWLSIYHHMAEAYHRWFFREGDAARPGYLPASKALRTHMPELVPVYQNLVDLAGGGDFAARLLALWCPTPYLTGCSQAVWHGATPILVRNYDYHPSLWDGILLSSAWTDRRVIAMSDSLWGVLDGINQDGLAVSLAFGGRQVVGEGFGMPLILRYVLETCRTVEEGSAALSRIPSHMSYNVTLLDARGHHSTVFVAPDRRPIVTHRPMATNHQRVIEWEAFAHATASLDRERYLRARLDDPSESPERFVERFLEPPLHVAWSGQGWGTLYTAVYEPRTRSMELHWTGATLKQSIEQFQESAVTLSFLGQPPERIPE